MTKMSCVLGAAQCKISWSWFRRVLEYMCVFQKYTQHLSEQYMCVRVRVYAGLQRAAMSL